jgi:hypothetical protein
MNEEQEIEFLSLLSKLARGDKEHFYNLFTNYIEKRGIKLHDPIQEEQRLYDLAVYKELAGYKIIHSLSDSEDIQERFSKYCDKSIDTYFHFSYEIEGEEKLSLSSIYEKWDNFPPRGWVAKFCKCGNFFPISLEINEMDVGEYKVLDILGGKYRPYVLNINDINVINFCTDNVIRFEMKNGIKLCCKPYKFDTAIIFGFIDDFTKLF